MVVAGGNGTRFGGPKQFAELRGRSLIAWSIDAARSAADGVVLVVPAGDVDEVRDSGRAEGADVVVPGGPRRADSVRAGLAAVPEDAAVVVVHDGARPLAPPALFRRVVEAVVAGADAAVPGLAVADTLKRADHDTVVATVARDGLVAVQTPQAFRAALLRQAHASGGDATDDAALVEALGATVRIVPGDRRNVKVTDRADLDLADALAGS